MSTATKRQQSATQKRVKLREVAKQARKHLFEMLKLADEILSDHEYVDEQGGEVYVIDDMEANEFAHFGGSPSLSQMLRAYRKNPRRATWDEYQHNVWAMIELADDRGAADQKERVNWKSLAKDLEAKLSQAQAALDEYRASAAELRRKCDELIAENGELRGRVKTLEEFAR